MCRCVGVRVRGTRVRTAFHLYYATSEPYGYIGVHLQRDDVAIAIKVGAIRQRCEPGFAQLVILQVDDVAEAHSKTDLLSPDSLVAHHVPVHEVRCTAGTFLTVRDAKQIVVTPA